MRLEKKVYEIDQHVDTSKVARELWAYLLNSVVETQVRVVLDLIDIFRVQHNHGLRGSYDLKDVGSL